MLLERDDWTTGEVGSLIRERFGVEYSTRSVYRILRSLGMRYGKPYPRDYRRPEDAEERLKRRVEEASKEGGRFMVGFLDECRPQTGSNTRRVWSFGDPEIRKDTTKYKANTFGFYAPWGGSVVCFKENSRKESVCEFLEEIREENLDGRILLILDNFASHRAEKTREKAGELDIRLVYLPPYSPDLNPIEQIWRGLKRRISTALFRTREGFMKLIEETYNQLSKKISYAEGWIYKFLPEQFNQLCPKL
jgi:transposase